MATVGGVVSVPDGGGGGGGGGGGKTPPFDTLTVMEKVALLSAASLAIAVRVWEPLVAVVVFQSI